MLSKVNLNFFIFSSKSLLLISRSHSDVRVRFAPSPTGFLHLGGLRTALYNYLFAKSLKGTFILRIEDTDQSRFVSESLDSIEDTLHWANIIPDESQRNGGLYGPYIQSERLKYYKYYISTLLQSEAAYRCYCSEARLDLMRKDALRRREIPRYDNKCRFISQSKRDMLEKQCTPYCIRLKLQDLTEPFEDLVYGSICHNVFDYEGDPVIMKMDGYPTYHFANVVDDHMMEITHVLRGVEWQVSTPKHLMLYKAFGWKPPKFAHLPLIRNKDGSKLSKRQGDLHVEALRNQGVSSNTILNFITEGGGGFQNRDQNKFYSLQKLIDMFDLSKLTTNFCCLDFERLQYFSRLELHSQVECPKELLTLISKVRKLVLSKYGNNFTDWENCQEISDEFLRKLMIWAKPRLTKIEDIIGSEFEFLWRPPKELSTESFVEIKNAFVVLEELCLYLSLVSEESFPGNDTSAIFSAVAKKVEVKKKLLMQLTRIALSGVKEGPPIAEMLSMLGKVVTLQRIKAAVETSK